jgi:hypothetical protein
MQNVRIYLYLFTLFWSRVHYAKKWGLVYNKFMNVMGLLLKRGSELWWISRGGSPLDWYFNKT